MKILHTADWHIGKILHKRSLQDEFILFSEWLLDTIKEESIELLLISGDVFDLANPSAKDRRLYYQLLRNLNELNIQIVITGGNHDSVGLLNAPKEILDVLNVHVIGGALDTIEDELIPIKNEAGEALIIAAVPFLRDKDLRNAETDELYKNRTEAIREGIKKHYQILANVCEDKYKGIPSIAMGHLYAIGADPSDSERDIHVGNAAAIDASIFSGFDYVALGHIHRPQIIGKNEMVRYSGSPIALSFSEKKDIKSVVIIELQDGKFSSPEIVVVPKFRELKKIAGDYSQVTEALKNYKPDFPLVSFVELEINEAEFSPLMLAKVEDLKLSYQESLDFTILKGRTIFKAGTKDTSDLFESGANIEDLKTTDVFSKRLESENLSVEQIAGLTDAFIEILELVQEKEVA